MNEDELELNEETKKKFKNQERNIKKEVFII